MTQLTCMLMPKGPVGAVLDLAVEAERAGYARVWIPDEGLSARECYVTLGAIAAATDRVQVGTGITNAYTRHPGTTAAAIATLDELSGGRAVFGVGAGGALTLNPLAIERVAPLRAVRNLIDVSRRLWAGESVETAADTGSFHSARMDYGRADIPIWIAGRGPKMMHLAGELADGFILSYVHKELIGDHVASISASASAAGRPRPRLAYMTQIATTDAQLEAARASLTFRLVDSSPETRERVGIGEDDINALRQALADGGPAGAAHLVRPEWVTQFVIAGSPSECASELKTLISENDLDEFQVSVNDIAAGAETLANIASLFQV
jgi:5,10-methylenetetrahydromethanopterin reductase